MTNKRRDAGPPQVVGWLGSPLGGQRTRRAVQARVSVGANSRATEIMIRPAKRRDAGPPQVVGWLGSPLGGQRTRRAVQARVSVGANNGAAIISVLLTVTLATLVVSGLFLREHVTVRSVENRLALTQTRWVERAAVDWSKVILAADGRTGKFDHLGEPWAVPVEETRLDETVTAGARIDDDTRAATLSGSMHDAQGRFNLNNLITTLQEGGDGSPTIATNQREIFENLLDLLGLPSSLAQTLAARLLAAAPAPPNAALGQQDQAFEVALPLLRVGDLKTVRGFDAEIIETLEPFVTLLPSRTRINVNTAEPEVLAAAVDGLEIGSARQLVTAREKRPFRAISEFVAAITPPPEAGQVKVDLLDVQTQYFLVKGLIRFGRVESLSETLLQRQQRRVNVIWQRRL